MERDRIITVCRVISQEGMTANRVLILNAAQYTPLMSELATEVGCSRQAVTGLVKTAIKDGLLKRIPADAKHDLRKFKVTLTAKGKKALLKLFSRFEPTSA